MSSITIKDLSITHDRSFTLSVPDLRIESGEIFGLIGESGCGKTTFLRAISGLLAPKSGQVLIDNQDVTALPTEEREMAMVFQEPRLFDHMTVLDNVCFPLTVRGTDKKIRIQRAKDLLALVGLQHKYAVYPATLSGGQKQRVSIARALAADPKILLLDEPFSGLDPELRHEMRTMVKSLQKSLQITILFVTHHMEEASQLFDRICLLHNGKPLQIDTPDQLFLRPASVTCAQATGCKNLLHGTKISSGFLPQNGTRPLPIHVSSESGSLLLPNHALDLQRTAANAVCLEATLVTSSYHQGVVYHTFAFGGIDLELTELYTPSLDRTIGKTYDIWINSSEVIFYPD